MPARLHKGDKAPDFDFRTPWENGLRFPDISEGNPAVLFFLRYYGCPVCRMEMADIKHHIALFQQKQANVFVLLQSAPDTVAAASTPEDWPFTIVCDPVGDIFRKYGVAPGGLLKYLHPSGLVAAIKATARGFRHGKFEGHETQVPAVFVVGTNHFIRYGYYGKTIDDLPPLKIVAAQIV